MAQEFQTIWTLVGQAKLAEALATGTPLVITHMAVGDGDYTPTSGLTALVNEVWRGPLVSSEVNPDNANWLEVRSTIVATVGDFTIREVGLFDEDGDLVVVSKYPATYKPIIAGGSTIDLDIVLVTEIQNAESVTIQIDAAVAIASVKFVLDEIEKHRLDPNPHPNLTIDTTDEVARDRIAQLTEAAHNLGAQSILVGHDYRAFTFDDASETDVGASSGYSISTGRLSSSRVFSSYSTANYGGAQLTFSGAQQNMTVPSGVYTLRFKMWGAGGGRGRASGANTFGPGGGGGFAVGDISVSPGETLVLITGGGGKQAPPTGGGQSGGAGGGLSGVFRGAYAQANALLIAGGGGGGSSDSATLGSGGAGGGTSGQSTSPATGGGDGGTQVAGGAGGIANDANGFTGSALQGGDGGGTGLASSVGGFGGGGDTKAFSSSVSGAGGGGGYFGGGGGGSPLNEAAGGGGSGYASAGVANVTLTAGSNETPANSTDVDRVGAGEGGVSTDGANGLIALALPTGASAFTWRSETTALDAPVSSARIALQGVIDGNIGDVTVTATNDNGATWSPMTLEEVADTALDGLTKQYVASGAFLSSGSEVAVEISHPSGPTSVSFDQIYLGVEP